MLASGRHGWRHNEAEGTMENTSATPDLPGEEKPGAERGGVFTNLVLALVSIAIIVSEALFLAGIRPGHVTA
jgi:hypothetical protein